MNMVRAGKVAHPREWRWCGYDELMGKRERYRILDTDALLQHLGSVGAASFRETYAAGLEEHIVARTATREAAWTEGVAVGSRLFVERVVRDVGRTQIRYTQLPSSGAEAWCVREADEVGYGAEKSTQTGC